MEPRFVRSRHHRLQTHTYVMHCFCCRAVLHYVFSYKNSHNHTCVHLSVTTCRAYIFPVVINVPINVSAHAR